MLPACAERRAEVVPLRMAVAMALRARAAVLLESRPALAAETALASAVAAAEAGIPVEAALSRMFAGRALRSRRLTRGASRARARRCRADAIGALRDSATRRSASSAAGPPQPPPPAPASPGRDRSRARSPHGRRRSPASSSIARPTPRSPRRSSCSQKTVESHIRNMFIKLGVKSRVELARAVVRADGEARTP